MEQTLCRYNCFLQHTEKFIEIKSKSKIRYDGISCNSMVLNNKIQLQKRNINRKVS